MIIIGIDPGTATTGYGVIKVKRQKAKAKNRLKCLGYGVIETDPSLSPEERLRKLHNGLSRLLSKYKPKIMAVERLYFFKNSKTVIPVGEARGVILLAAVKKKIKVCELSPLEVKMGICGYGRADKKQVSRMVREILDLEEIPKPDDAADGLAIAISCVFKNRLDPAPFPTKD